MELTVTREQQESRAQPVLQERMELRVKQVLLARPVQMAQQALQAWTELRVLLE